MQKRIFDERQLPPMITLEETAALLNIDRETARRMAFNGELPAFKISERIWRVDKTALLAQCKELLPVKFRQVI